MRPPILLLAMFSICLMCCMLLTPLAKAHDGPHDMPEIGQLHKLPDLEDRGPLVEPERLQLATLVLFELPPDDAVLVEQPVSAPKKPSQPTPPPPPKLVSGAAVSQSQPTKVEAAYVQSTCSGKHCQKSRHRRIIHRRCRGGNC